MSLFPGLTPGLLGFSTMLARVLSAAVNGIKTFPVEAEVNCGWGDTVIAMIMLFSPIPKPVLLLAKDRPTPLRQETIVAWE